jgi:ATP-dependent protease HslVU (ClpYQ) peptidase subunit
MTASEFFCQYTKRPGENRTDWWLEFAEAYASELRKANIQLAEDWRKERVLKERAAELLRIPNVIDGRTDWFEKRDQLLKEVEGK